MIEPAATIARNLIADKMGAVLKAGVSAPSTLLEISTVPCVSYSDLSPSLIIQNIAGIFTNFLLHSKRFCKQSKFRNFGTKVFNSNDGIPCDMLRRITDACQQCGSGDTEFTSVGVRINRVHCRTCDHHQSWPQIEIAGNNANDLVGLVGALLLAGIGAYALGKLLEALLDRDTTSNRPRYRLERRYARNLR